MSADNDFEVERLVSIRRNAPRGGNCGIRVLIKWKGFSDKDNTWEPLENLNPSSAPVMLEELEDLVKNNSVKRQMVRDALAIISEQNPEIRKQERGRSKNKSPFKLSESDTSKIKRKSEKSKDILSVTNQSINSGAQSNFSDPINATLMNKAISAKNLTMHSPLVPKNAHRNSEIVNDFEPLTRSIKHPSLIQPVVCESVSVSQSNSQASKAPTVKRALEEYYTGIQRKSKNSDVYMVSKVWIDSRDKEVLSSELIDLMQEFRLTDEKEVLMKLCLQRLSQLENTFQSIADWTIRTVSKRAQEGNLN